MPPLNTETEYWEIYDKNVEVLIYDGAKFYFDNNKLVSFDLTKSNYHLKLNQQNIEVGDSINTLQLNFPNSYAYRSNGGFAIDIDSGDFSFLYLNYNLSGIITKIEHRFY
ncbi:MAG: hypothetical protein CL868_11885 [Cytophagaceae bacterium]|nr:hypothetical protein [Cytophagaceae bacterium]